MDSDSDGAEVVPDPKAKESAIVRPGDSEDDDSEPLRPLAKKTKKEKAEDRGKKKARVNFKTLLFSSDPKA